MTKLMRCDNDKFIYCRKGISDLLFTLHAGAQSLIYHEWIVSALKRISNASLSQLMLFWHILSTRSKFYEKLM